MKNDQIKKLKEEIKLLKEINAVEEHRANAQAQYSSDLSAKLDEALERLSMIARKRYYPAECNQGNSDIGASTAANGIKKIARMRERKP